jgi:hypothetical protein
LAEGRSVPGTDSALGAHRKRKHFACAESVLGYFHASLPGLLANPNVLRENKMQKTPGAAERRAESLKRLKVQK